MTEFLQTILKSAVELIEPILESIPLEEFTEKLFPTLAAGETILPILQDSSYLDQLAHLKSLGSESDFVLETVKEILGDDFSSLYDDDFLEKVGEKGGQAALLLNDGIEKLVQAAVFRSMFWRSALVFALSVILLVPAFLFIPAYLLAAIGFALLATVGGEVMEPMGLRSWSLGFCFNCCVQLVYFALMCIATVIGGIAVGTGATDAETVWILFISLWSVLCFFHVIMLFYCGIMIVLMIWLFFAIPKPRSLKLLHSDVLQIVDGENESALGENKESYGGIDTVNTLLEELNKVRTKDERVQKAVNLLERTKEAIHNVTEQEANSGKCIPPIPIPPSVLDVLCEALNEVGKKPQNQKKGHAFSHCFGHETAVPEVPIETCQKLIDTLDNDLCLAPKWSEFEHESSKHWIFLPCPEKWYNRRKYRHAKYDPVKFPGVVYISTLSSFDHNSLSSDLDWTAEYCFNTFCSSFSEKATCASFIHDTDENNVWASLCYVLPSGLLCSWIFFWAMISIIFLVFQGSEPATYGWIALFVFVFMCPCLICWGYFNVGLHSYLRLKAFYEHELFDAGYHGGVKDYSPGIRCVYYMLEPWLFVGKLLRRPSSVKRYKETLISKRSLHHFAAESCPSKSRTCGSGDHYEVSVNDNDIAIVTLDEYDRAAVFFHEMSEWIPEGEVPKPRVLFEDAALFHPSNEHECVFDQSDRWVCKCLDSLLAPAQLVFFKCSPQTILKMGGLPWKDVRRVNQHATDCTGDKDTEVLRDAISDADQECV